MAFTAINKCFQSKTWLLGRVSYLAGRRPSERRMTGTAKSGKRQGAKEKPVAGMSRIVVRKEKSGRLD
jgi:hypothetical protein